MASDFQLSRTDLVLLIINLLMLGGCIVLLLVSGPSGPLILLTIGVMAVTLGKIGAGFLKPKQDGPKKASGTLDE